MFVAPKVRAAMSSFLLVMGCGAVSAILAYVIYRAGSAPSRSDSSFKMLLPSLDYVQKQGPAPKRHVGAKRVAMGKDPLLHRLMANSLVKRTLLGLFVAGLLVGTVFLVMWLVNAAKGNYWFLSSNAAANNSQSGMEGAGGGGGGGTGGGAGSNNSQAQGGNPPAADPGASIQAIKIAGMVIGCIVGIIIAIWVVFWYRRKYSPTSPELRKKLVRPCKLSTAAINKLNTASGSLVVGMGHVVGRSPGAGNNEEEREPTGEEQEEEEEEARTYKEATRRNLKLFFEALDTVKEPLREIPLLSTCLRPKKDVGNALCQFNCRWGVYKGETRNYTIYVYNEDDIVDIYKEVQKYKPKGTLFVLMSPAAGGGWRGVFGPNDITGMTNVYVVDDSNEEKGPMPSAAYIASCVLGEHFLKALAKRTNVPGLSYLIEG